MKKCRGVKIFLDVYLISLYRSFFVLTCMISHLLSSSGTEYLFETSLTGGRAIASARETTPILSSRRVDLFCRMLGYIGLGVLATTGDLPQVTTSAGTSAPEADMPITSTRDSSWNFNPLGFPVAAASPLRGSRQNPLDAHELDFDKGVRSGRGSISFDEMRFPKVDKRWRKLVNRQIRAYHPYKSHTSVTTEVVRRLESLTFVDFPPDNDSGAGEAASIIAEEFGLNDHKEQQVRERIHEALEENRPHLESRKKYKKLLGLRMRSTSCPGTVCVGYEFETSTVKMVRVQDSSALDTVMDIETDKAGVFYHPDAIMLTGDLRGTVEAVTYPLSSGDEVVTAGDRLTSFFQGLHDKATAEEKTHRGILVTYTTPHYIEGAPNTVLSEEGFLFNSGYTFKDEHGALIPAPDLVRFGLDTEKIDEGDSFFAFKFNPHMTAGIPMKHIFPVLMGTSDISFNSYKAPVGDSREDIPLFSRAYHALIQALRDAYDDASDEVVAACKEPAGAVGFLGALYLENFSRGDAFPGNDPKRSVKVMVRTDFHGMYHKALLDEGSTEQHFDDCLGHYLIKTGMNVDTTRVFQGKIYDSETVREDVIPHSGGRKSFVFGDGSTTLEIASERIDKVTAGKCVGPIVSEWIASIKNGANNGRDWLSPVPCYRPFSLQREGMGALGIGGFGESQVPLFEFRSFNNPCRGDEGVPICNIAASLNNVKELMGASSTYFLPE